MKASYNPTLSITLALTLLGVISVTASASASSPWELTGTTEFPREMQPLVFEGLCAHHGRFVMNTKYSVFVMDTQLNVVTSTPNAIPSELLEEGYNHLGDCVCDEVTSLCYYAVEEPSKTKPSIFVYNLTSAGVIFKTEKHQPIQSHMPWVALDPVTGYLYSSEYDNVNELRVYSAETLDYLHTVSIDGDAIPLNGVQGGAFYSGKLYVGINAGDSVFEIDVTTGHTELSIQQFPEGSSSEYEFEGLTFLDLRSEGKGMMHNTGNHIHPQVMFHADVKGL
jgi:hypothetical protein